MRIGAFEKFRRALISRQLRRFSNSEVDLHPTEQTLMLPDVIRTQFFKSLFAGCFQICFGEALWITANILIAFVTCRSGNQNRGRVGICDCNSSLLDCGLASVRLNEYAGLKSQCTFECRMLLRSRRA